MKKFEKKLNLVKTTVANLGQAEMNDVKGALGGIRTIINCPSNLSLCCMTKATYMIGCGDTTSL